MKHTPGPWQVSGVRARSLPIGRYCQLHMVGPDGDSVAAVFFDIKTGRGFEDARLIAAAPAMRAYIERRAMSGDAEAKALLGNH